VKTSENKIVNVIWLVFAITLCIQWIIFKHAGYHLTGSFAPVLPGLAIFGAAFILSWSAELAQIDIPRSFAFAILALVAVLPEYAVDMYFSWMAARNPAYHPYPVANMTGGNRLLIGFGWALIVFVYWVKNRDKKLILDPACALEIKVLLIATLYSFIISLKKNISLLDSLVFIGIFIFYISRALKGHVIEPEESGPAELIAKIQKTPRRIVTVIFFLLSGYTIFISAEPFSEGLLEAGRHLGIEEFILVQWIAPLASESPEFIVAMIFALRNLPDQGFLTLLSSKINQWTLLIGMIPIIYSISGKNLSPLYLDSRQLEEMFLTSAQSLFAVSVLSNFVFSLWEALILLVLFATQLFFFNPVIRYGYASIYMILTIFFFLFSKSHRQSMVGYLGGGKSLKR